MSLNRVVTSSAFSRPPPAFSLIELLVVLAITSLLISIIVPALSAGREAANIARCLGNLREIGAAAGMYMDDEARMTQPWHLGTDHGVGPITTVTEFVYGGFLVEADHPVHGGKVDVRKIVTQTRPFNKYIAPGFCEGPIQTYMCPSDRYLATPAQHTGDPPIIHNGYSSVAANGNSYAMNWNWLESAPWNSKRAYCGDIYDISRAGEAMLNMKIGGPASKFVLIMEAPMNAFMQSARPRDGSCGESCEAQFVQGWHKKTSQFTTVFLDGHADYRYFDPRYSDGPDYNLWPEPKTPSGLAYLPY